MDSILVVFYSLTGVSRRAARLLASHHGWPLGEIHDVHRRRGGWGHMRCVLDSLFERRPAIRYEGPDPGDFRTVVIVSPIWAMRLAGPMRSFIADNAQRLGRIAQVSTMDASSASNAIREVARLTHLTPVATAQFTSRELEDASGIARLLRFGDAFFAPAERGADAGSAAAAWHPAKP